ncbi:hypothetical protein IBX73_05365 [candidate division WOR-3 bacterium]|nr:hypothetical protein [candidate division WOR-3 bacterium]
MIFALIAFFISFEHSTSVKQVDFSRNQIQLETADGYTKVRMDGCEITGIVGAPELPMKAFTAALPLGAEDIRVEIIGTETTILDGEYFLSCAQPPVVLSQSEITRIVPPDEDIYTSNLPYPERIIEVRGIGTFDNHQICELVFHPVQYMPETGKLLHHEAIRFRLTYKGGSRLPAQGSNLKKMVLNPEDLLETRSPRTRDDISYLIISNPPVDTVFQRLADWKTQKGIPAQVRTVNWVLANYAGEDNAARIRNYIKTLPDSNIQYVLLAGDTAIIPCRFAYAMTCSAFIWNREDSLPCDLYYADLQGDWNFDGDGLYGEIEDSIDLYPDLYVGRAPINSIVQAQNFVSKILTYEKNPPHDYLDNALLLAEILWNNPYTDQGIHKNRIEEESFPSNLEVTKLYESLGNENRTAVMNAIRSGQNLINHDGHGNTSLMGVGVGYLNFYDLDTISNGQKCGIIFSLGCWTAAFDFNCIAEAWMNNTNGGGVAFVGNSSYGWGSPGNPGFGISDIFDSRFFYSLLVENNYRIGEALAMCKTYFIPYSREKNVYRWHQYELNLLGDPEMAVWTALPESIIVAAPQSIPTGSSSILFAVRNKNSGEPISGALVCLMKENESYAASYTDASGQVFLEANPVTTGDFLVTVTAHNHIPLETTIPVVSGPYVNYQGWLLNDSLGNGDSIANPNEPILLSTMLKNTGNATAYNINTKLRSEDPYVTILDSTEYLNTLTPGDSICLDNAFNIQVGSTTNAHTLCFELEIAEASRTVAFYPGIMVGTPLLSIAEFTIENAPTMPADTALLYIDVANAGYGYAHATQILLSSADPYVAVITDSISFGDIPPETVRTAGPFNIAVAPGCPPGHHPQLSFVMSAESYSFSEEVTLLIGETGFADNMEAGYGLWTTGGTNNLWHVSTRRAFSPTHSWYCGQEASGLYVNNMNCYIQTIPFMVDHNSSLRFMRWFQVPIYGSDGIYVIIVRNSGSDTLDFIGTGGALGGGRALQSDWLEQTYSLAQYAGGDTIQIRIAFISDYDGDVAEGFYIDDINIANITCVQEYISESIHPLHLEVQPNPFRHETSIRFMIPDSASTIREATLRIYDAAGRLVRSFPILPSEGGNLPYQGNGSSDALRYTFSWDGSDNQGRNVAPGIYFVMLCAGNNDIGTKIILVR